MRRSPVVVVYANVIIDLFGCGIILPRLPYDAERFGAIGGWVGALLTAYSAALLGAMLVLRGASEGVLAGARPREAP